MRIAIGAVVVIDSKTNSTLPDSRAATVYGRASPRRSDKTPHMRGPNMPMRLRLAHIQPTAPIDMPTPAIAVDANGSWMPPEAKAKKYATANTRRGRLAMGSARSIAPRSLAVTRAERLVEPAYTGSVPRGGPMPVMTDGSAAQLSAHGDVAFKRGRWRQALQSFAGVVQAVPGNLQVRFRVADALLNVGQRELALDVYKAIAWHAIKAGHPLLGLVASKMILLLEPSYEDTLLALAELYSKHSERLDPLAPTPALVLVGDEPAQSLADDDELLHIAAARAAATDGTLPYPEALPALPLFSYLEEDAFLATVEKLRLRRFADEEIVIREGEHGESFFIIADGDILVKRDIDDDDGGVTLAHLHRGSVFGEMSLISDEPRQASAVAKGDVDVLEMRRADLVVAAASRDGVSQALKSFTRERFLRNLTATHPFFSGLSREERHSVMESFRIVTFPMGLELIQEGARGPGLFLLLGGAASVSKQAGGERIHLATLRGADVCGEMSLLGDQPTTATVTADEDLEALFLATDDFKAVVREHPELMKYLASLTDERVRQNRALLHGRGLFEDDEHVMI